MDHPDDHRIVTLLTQILARYRDIVPTPDMSAVIVPATRTEITALERTIGARLPAAYRQFLQINPVRHNFVGNFRCLDVREVARTWQGMTRLLEDGVFDDGRIAWHNAQGFGNWDDGSLTECWWSRHWIPLAEDSCGNLHCLDGQPGPRGVTYQVLAMEIQDGQGPFPTPYRSFTDYLAQHLAYLEHGHFVCYDWGIEIDPDRDAPSAPVGP